MVAAVALVSLDVLALDAQFVISIGCHLLAHNMPKWLAAMRS